MPEPLDPWRDPRVRAGMERLLARRRALLAGGAGPLGWKVALNAPAAQEGLGLTAPLVGFLTDAGLLRAGELCPVGGWTMAKLEPELGIHIGAPLGAGAGPADAAAAIAGISAAIELADVDRPFSDLEEVLAGDIYHRRVALSAEPPTAGLPQGPIAVAVERDGEPVAATEDAEASVGRLVELTAYVARYLAEFGCGLSPGDILISGSTVPLIDVAPGQSLRSTVAGVGSVDVTLS